MDDIFLIVKDKDLREALKKGTKGDVSEKNLERYNTFQTESLLELARQKKELFEGKSPYAINEIDALNDIISFNTDKGFVKVRLQKLVYQG